MYFCTSYCTKKHCSHSAEHSFKCDEVPLSLSAAPERAPFLTEDAIHGPRSSTTTRRAASHSPHNVRERVHITSARSCQGAARVPPLHTNSAKHYSSVTAGLRCRHRGRTHRTGGNAVSQERGRQRTLTRGRAAGRDAAERSRLPPAPAPTPGGADAALCPPLGGAGPGAPRRAAQSSGGGRATSSAAAAPRAAGAPPSVRGASPLRARGAPAPAYIYGAAARRPQGCEAGGQRSRRRRRRRGMRSPGRSRRRGA